MCQSLSKIFTLPQIEMIDVPVHIGQTMVDIAIQEYGCFEGVFMLAEDNNISPTHKVQPGDVLKVREPVPFITDNNQAVAAENKANNIRVNSGFGIDEPTGEPPVETDFFDPDYFNPNYYG